MNRGYLYGDGFFETIRVHNGEIPLADYHVNRILEGLETYQIATEILIDDEFIKAICKSYKMENAIVRINFFRDGKGKYLPETNALVFDHSAEETTSSFFLPVGMDLIKELGSLSLEKGIFGLYSDAKPNHPLFRVKSLSSAYYVQAAIYQAQKQIDYLLITCDGKTVCEEIRSNLILQNGEQFIIPPTDSGGVFGATLRFLIAYYPSFIEEQEITVEDIKKAEKVYLTRGSRGVIRIQ